MKLKGYIIALMMMLLLTGCTGGRDKQVDTNFLIENYRPEFHELNLVAKDLTKVPNFEKYLTGSYKDDIWSITLQDNSINKVDFQKFEYFPNLRELNLSYNNIKKVKYGNIPVEKLLLHKNKISSVDLSELTRLQELNLGYNKIESGEDIQLPDTLMTLELQHNELEDIYGIDKQKNLETIKLEFNKLEDTDMVVLKDLKKLKFISVKQNKLTQELEDGFANFNEVMSQKEQ